MLLGAYQFDWSVVPEYLPTLLRAVLVTLQVSALAMAVGVVAGFVVALGRMSRFLPVRWISIAYIDLLRGVPILVILLWVYYGITIVSGISLSALQAAIIGLGASYAAFLAEIFRSGVQAVPPGQREAGRTLGLNNRQIMGKIVLPQAFRIIIPPFGNTLISMIKDSSLVSILAVEELLRETQVIAATTFRPFELFAAAGLIYYLMAVITARLVNVLERRLDKSGRTPGSSGLTRLRTYWTRDGLAPGPAGALPVPPTAPEK